MSNSPAVVHPIGEFLQQQAANRAPALHDAPLGLEYLGVRSEEGRSIDGESPSVFTQEQIQQVIGNFNPAEHDVAVMGVVVPQGYHPDSGLWILRDRDPRLPKYESKGHAGEPGVRYIPSPDYYFFDPSTVRKQMISGKSSFLAPYKVQMNTVTATEHGRQIATPEGSHGSISVAATPFEFFVYDSLPVPAHGERPTYIARRLEVEQPRQTDDRRRIVSQLGSVVRRMFRKGSH